MKFAIGNALVMIASDGILDEGKGLGPKTKGRIAVGTDADVTVVDPAKVIDRAPF